MCALKSRMLLVTSNTSVCVPLLTVFCFGDRRFVESFAHGPDVLGVAQFSLHQTFYSILNILPIFMLR